MTYDELDARLGTLLHRSEGFPDPEGGRICLFTDGEGRYGVYEYDTAGFPPPNDPDNEDRWLRNARDTVYWGGKKAISDLLGKDYFPQIWGRCGKDFCEKGLKVLADV